MQETNCEQKNTKNFFKKNGYYFILAGLVLVLALVIGLTSIISTTNEPAQETNTSSITFVSPVANASISKSYNESELQYNATLNEWSIHKAIDFSATKGANVMASYDGTVESISTNLLDGTCITINHGDGLKTVYKSLDEEVKVSVGDKVSSGQVIGYVAGSATGETTETSHLHYEVWKDDNKVDPAGYLQIDNK